MTAVARTALLVAVTCAALACRDTGPSRKSADALRSADLSGTWDIRLRLERPVVLVSDTTRSAKEVHGDFAFVRNHARRDRYPEVGIPTYYGTYDIDFAPFGFAPGASGDPPSALATVFDRDSVLIVLDATNTELTLTLRGSIGGDSVAGGWTASSRRVGGGGSYVMRRVMHPAATP